MGPVKVSSAEVITHPKLYFLFASDFFCEALVFVTNLKNATIK